MNRRILATVATVAAMALPPPLPAAAHHLGTPQQSKAYDNGLRVEEFIYGEKPDRIKVIAVVLPDDTLDLVIALYESPPICRVAERAIGALLPDFDTDAPPVMGRHLDEDGHCTAIALGSPDALLAIGFMPEDQGA